MKYLVNTRSGKILARGREDILRTISSWDEFEICRNGRVITQGSNCEYRTFTTKTLRDALGFYREWTSPRGVEPEYDIVDGKTLDIRGWR